MGLKFSLRHISRWMRVLVPYQVIHDLKEKEKEQQKRKKNRPRDRTQTISPLPPAIEISTPGEIITTSPHPPLLSHDSYCLGVDVKPSSLPSWGPLASPPGALWPPLLGPFGLPSWGPLASPPCGSCSRSSLTRSMMFCFPPYPALALPLA